MSTLLDRMERLLAGRARLDRAKRLPTVKHVAELVDTILDSGVMKLRGCLARGEFEGLDRARALDVIENYERPTNRRGEG